MGPENLARLLAAAAHSVPTLQGGADKLRDLGNFAYAQSVEQAALDLDKARHNAAQEPIPEEVEARFLTMTGKSVQMLQQAANVLREAGDFSYATAMDTAAEQMSETLRRAMQDTVPIELDAVRRNKD